MENTANKRDSFMAVRVYKPNEKYYRYSSTYRQNTHKKKNELYILMSFRLLKLYLTRLYFHHIFEDQIHPNRSLSNEQDLLHNTQNVL